MRYIGIRFREKRTVQGERRPTQVFVINENGPAASYELETEDAELDWLRGRCPLTWRSAKPDEDIDSLPEHHVLWKDVKDPEPLRGKRLLRQNSETDRWQKAQVPATYDGFQAGDVINTVLTGTGSPYAFALSRRAEDIGAQVFRATTKLLHDHRAALGRENTDRDGDAEILARLVKDEQQLLYPTVRRDRDLIRLREVYLQWQESQVARIGCEHRVRQIAKREVYCREDGSYPEGSLEQLLKKRVASDPILAAFRMEEKRRVKELEGAVEAFDIYRELFAPVEGLGHRISARLIVAIGDIRKFPTEHHFKAYLGAHVRKGGKYASFPKSREFPRRRRGEVPNWQEEGRQALYLVVDQFNKRPKAMWGQKLLMNKAAIRAKHPEPAMVEVDDVKVVEGQSVPTKKLRKQYTDGHTLNMAKWRTATQFAVYLYKRWTRLEAAASQPVMPSVPEAVPA